MGDVLTDLSAPGVVRAIEENLFQYFQLLGRVPGAELREGPELMWCVSGVPHPLFNQVVRARLDAARADAAIEAAVARCRARGVPMAWWTGPSTRPADLGARLAAHGLARHGELPGMAADLALLPEPEGPGDVDVAPVEDAGALREWCDVCGAGFGRPALVGDVLFEAYRGLGLGPHLPIRLYLARSGGAPVAAASVFLGAGVAGVYEVATAPEARRRGFGRAATLGALLGARSLGYRVGILHASAMGVGVYRQLGFEPYCALQQYLWAG